MRRLTSRFLLLATCLALLLTLGACMEDEDYTVSANDRLVFSTDTVAFDTIISGTPTQTYTFTVYNRAGKAIRIPRVALEQGAASPFRVNVDGTTLTGGEASGFEIAAKDSMIVYLMANVPEQDTDLPVGTEDKLVFTTEAGVSQEVVLTAAGQAVVTLTGERVREDAVLAAKRPYRILDSIVVEEGATLTLAAGTRLYMHADAEIIVHGTLRIAGTLEEPVTIRGDRLGYMFDGQPYDRIPGQWGGIRLTATSYGNHFSYADIHSGDYGVRADSSDVTREKLTIENSVIHNSTHNGLDVRMANVYVGNSQITNAGGNCVQVRGGDVSLIHCTVGRFYVFTGGSGVALDFSNFDGNARLPLTRLLVVNSIITGYQDDEIMGSANADFPEDSYAYGFLNCLMNTVKPEEENQSIVNCLWDIDEDAETPEGQTEKILHDLNFTPEFDLDALTFSFELSPYSRAVGNAETSWTAAAYPNDRLGRPRGTLPDIGCYQHTETDPGSAVP